jgi:hypothetical protein
MGGDSWPLDNLELGRMSANFVFSYCIFPNPSCYLPLGNLEYRNFSGKLQGDGCMHVTQEWWQFYLKVSVSNMS